LLAIGFEPQGVIGLENFFFINPIRNAIKDVRASCVGYSRDLAVLPDINIIFTDERYDVSISDKMLIFPNRCVLVGDL
jgi:hypothetical protein